MKDEKVKGYYEGEAEDYETDFYRKKDKYPTLRYRHNYILEMVAAIGLPEKARILDIGCGPGEMVIDLMQQKWEIWGIDIAESMIEIAERKLVQHNQKAAKEAGSEPLNPNQVHLSVGDIEKLEFEDGFFDLVIASGVVEYLKDDDTWPKELSRVLKPQGHLILNVTNKFAVRRWTSGPVEKLKSSKLMYKSMNFVKENVLRRGKLHHFPFRPRLHSPKKFDRFMAEKGFEKVSHNYFDFSIFPAPFDTVLGFVSTPIRKWMERYSKKNMLINGTGYIVNLRKKG